MEWIKAHEVALKYLKDNNAPQYLILRCEMAIESIRNATVESTKFIIMPSRIDKFVEPRKVQEILTEQCNKDKLAYKLGKFSPSHWIIDQAIYLLTGNVEMSCLLRKYSDVELLKACFRDLYPVEYKEAKRIINNVP